MKGMGRQSMIRSFFFVGAPNSETKSELWDLEATPKSEERILPSWRRDNVKRW